MPKAHNPRRGSTQYWPRKRSRYSLARIRYWGTDNKPKALGFIGYKAGMTHILVSDNHPKSLTKGETISLPTTIIDCPPMIVMGVSFYKNSPFGLKKVTSILAANLNKDLGRKIPLPKKAKEAPKLAEIDFDDLRLIVHSNPKQTSAGTKKPKLIEVAVGGNKEEKLKFAQEVLGKEITIKDVFESGNAVDVHGITKGKGFQGTVKRYGVPIRQHKSEKTKRGIGNLGAWTPKRVDYTIPQAGKMGYHLRTEYNKQIIKIGDDGSDVTPKSGLQKYGIVKNNYLLLKGSVPGSRKRAIVMIPAIRINKRFTKDAPEVTSISK